MSLVAAAEEDLKAGEHMALADTRFLLLQPESIVPKAEKETLTANLMEGIKSNKMTAYYEECCSVLGWKLETREKRGS